MPARAMDTTPRTSATTTPANPSVWVICGTPSVSEYTVRSGGGFRMTATDDRARLSDDGLQMAKHFPLELVETLAEGVPEVGVAVLPAVEQAKVAHDAAEAVAGDEVVGH